MRGAGRLELDVDFPLLLQNVVEELLILLGLESLPLNALPSAGGHEEEDVVGRRSELDGEVGHVDDLVLIPLGDRGVHLEGHAQPLAVLHRLNGDVPGAGHAAELVVDLPLAAIEADAHASAARRLQLLDPLRRQQRPVRPQHHPEARLRAVLHEVEDVRPDEGLATAQDEDAEAHLGDLVEELEALLGGQLELVRIRPRLPVAVGAELVALAGGVPRDDDHASCSCSHFAASLAW